MAGQVVGLVEAAVHGTKGMERHRHDAVRIAKHVEPGRAHESRKRRSQRAPPVILERVNERSEGTRVNSRTSRGFKGGRRRQAPAAHAEQGARSGQGITA
jgi:hypothetical protein